MSNFRFELNDTGSGRQWTKDSRRSPVFENFEIHKPRPKKPFVIAGLILISIAAAAVLGGFIYYQGFKGTPQYSLALLIDAAKRNDEAQVAALIDIDGIVDDFVPQITDKAIDLYGRGQTPNMLSKIQELAKPLLPAVKDRARAELPRVIRERTERFGYVPFSAMVLGADRYLDITVSGDTAVVSSKLRDHPLQLKMRRDGQLWRIVGVSDEQLATDIARKIGQEIISIASNGRIETADKFGGMGNLADLLRQAEELVR
ncbi:hypothetical protein BH20ACI2_BH20ACI2_00960 [soil metagenome]